MQTNKYKYSTFNELTTQGDYNFYGIIYDASIPTYTEDPQTRHETTLKLIDPSINPLTIPNPSDLQSQLITLIIKSTSPSTIPRVHSFGDIIRIHRGHYHPKAKRNVYLHITTKNPKSSWCIFAGCSDVHSQSTTPILSSHQSYTFEPQDTSIILALRSFLKDKLTKQNSLMFHMENKLNKRVIGTEQDVLVQVAYKIELQDQIVYYVQDETDGCELHTFKYFNFLDVGDVFRLRSYRVIDKNVIIMNQYSNVIKIPKFLWYYQDFLERMKNAYNAKSRNESEMLWNEKSDKKEFFDKIKYIATPKNVVCCVSEKFLQEKEIDMEVKMFDDAVKEGKGAFVVEVNVIGFVKGVDEDDDVVDVMCEKCKKIMMKGRSERMGMKCNRCNYVGKGIVHYNVAMNCVENNYADKVITLYLNTFDGKGNGFINVDAEEAWRNEEKMKGVKEYLKKLCERGMYVRVCVEKVNARDGEGIYRIIGKYNINKI